MRWIIEIDVRPLWQLGIGQGRKIEIRCARARVPNVNGNAHNGLVDAPCRTLQRIEGIEDTRELMIGIAESTQLRRTLRAHQHARVRCTRHEIATLIIGRPRQRLHDHGQHFWMQGELRRRARRANMSDRGRAAEGPSTRTVAASGVRSRFQISSFALI